MGVTPAKYERIQQRLTPGEVEAALGPGKEDFQVGNLRSTTCQSGVINLRLGTTIKEDRVTAKAILDCHARERARRHCGRLHAGRAEGGTTRGRQGAGGYIPSAIPAVRAPKTGRR
jgi:hypothetical protein